MFGQGTTWFYVPSDDNCLVFGSSFQTALSIHSQLPARLPSFNENLWRLFRQQLLRLLYTFSVPIHVTYSKYLLRSTLDRLLEAKK